MSVSSTIVGTTRASAVEPNREVTAWELRAGGLRAEIWSLGATLVALDVPDRDGATANVVARHDDLTGYDDPAERAGYLGATVGRWANRIRNGRCTVDGRDLVLETNDGVHHLHGGVGFDQRIWSIEQVADGVGEEAAAIEASLVSPDGDAGYPGRLEVAVRFTLSPTQLAIDYTATSDAVTPINLTNHAYWNLAGGGRIDDHRVTIPASRYLPVDEGSIPVGGPSPVAGTRFDFTAERALGPFEGDPLAAGYDHCLLPDGDGLRPIAAVHDPASGRTMRVQSDQPGVQLYTANYLEPPHTALCLETQRAPDAVNQPELGPALLAPGETYRHSTIHTFGIRER